MNAKTYVSESGKSLEEKKEEKERRSPTLKNFGIGNYMEDLEEPLV